MARTDAQAKYLTKRRVDARKYLGGCCVVCGATEKLEFDHIDPDTKVIEVSRAIAQHWSWERLVVELDKCQLLCRPHHVEKSKVDGSDRGGGWNRIDDPQHGTAVMYQTNGCRCEPCRQWRSLYRGGYVDARGVRLKEGSPRRIGNPEHGTYAKYNSGCRCEHCKAANSAKMREYREQKRSTKTAARN